MNSSMSNFNIKKSFVWKYGLSKLHKKKTEEECEPECESPTDDASSCCSLEPDLALQPQWEPLVWRETDDPATLPEKRRSLDPPPAGAAAGAGAAPESPPSAAAEAALPGYAVAGCRRVSVDGELPIYESLSEYGGALSEDQQTLYENDDTDEELSPLYENGPMSPVAVKPADTHEQPIYANGDVVEEPPIYENLFEEETVVARRKTTAAAAATGAESQYDDLRVEVRSDHGYDSYQSPSSGSSGASSGGSSGSRRSSASAEMMRVLPKHELVEDSGSQSSDSEPPPPPTSVPMAFTVKDKKPEKAVSKSKSVSEITRKSALETLVKAASEAMTKPVLKLETDAVPKNVPQTAPEPVLKAPSDSTQKPAPVSGKTEPLSGKPEPRTAAPTKGQPTSLTELLSAESLISAKQALKQSRVVNMVRPLAVKQTKTNTVLSGPASKKEEAKKMDDVKETCSDRNSGVEVRKMKGDLSGPKSLQMESKTLAKSVINYPLSLTDPPKEKSRPNSDPQPLTKDPPKQNSSFLHNGRSVGKLGDNAGFQQARKAIAQALHRRTAPPECSDQLKLKTPSSASPSAGPSSTRPDLTAPVERVTVTSGVIPPPPPMPAHKLTSPARQNPATVSLTSQTPAKPVSQAPTKLSSQTPAKPVSQTPAKPVSQPPTKLSSQTPAKPVSQTPAKPVSQPPPKLSSQTPAKPVSQSSAKLATQTPAKSVSQAPAKQSSQALVKTSTTSAMQSGLKKKLEAKKNSLTSEKLPLKKKRMAPKPPDRSLSLPGFGSSKMDIAKAFEEYKRNEEEKEREARSKKQKSNFLEELDAKMSKKGASQSGKGKSTVVDLSAETAKQNEVNIHAIKKDCLGKHSFNKFECSEYDLMQSMILPKKSTSNPAAQRISKREAREAKKKRQSPRIPSSLICATFPEQPTATVCPPHPSPSDSPTSETTKSYETVRDSSEITITDGIDPAQTTHKPNTTGSDNFRVASLVTPDDRTSGADRKLASSADDWLSAGDCPLRARDCCVTVGGLQVIRIAPEEADEPPFPTPASISLTVTADPNGQSPTPTGDRVALQVSHGLYHSSVVEVNAAQTWEDPASLRAAPASPAPSAVRPGSLDSAPLGTLPGSEAGPPGRVADCVAPLVISVSEVERQFEILERDHHWREDEDMEEEEDREEEEEEVQLRRRRRNRQRTSSEDGMTYRTPKSVEVLSIIANKQKTKHFLENRIQADLSAAETSTATSTSSTRDSTSSSTNDAGAGSIDSSPAPSSRHSSAQSSPVCSVRTVARGSRMSAPAPLCAPGLPPGDLGSAGTAGRRRSSIDAAPPETRIAREIREQRCREEELRRLRAAAGPPSPAGQDEPLSGYGSEEKDSLTEEGDSSGRGGSSRPLSRSQESLSSGHSSGLGSELPADTAGRRRVTVRPYEDQEDGEKWSAFARSTETPIEREIRLAREREEERRREQALRAPKPATGPRPQSTSAATQNRRAAPAPAPVEDHRQAALRLATGRVQNEIQEATRRELELRGEGHAITTSEETVDDKVTRLGDMTEHSRQVRQQWSEPGPRPVPVASRPALRPTSRPVSRPAPVATPVPAQPAFRPAATGTGRGLMAKFISSRGKLRPSGAFAAPAPAPPQPPLSRGLSAPERPSPPVAPAATGGVRRAGQTATLRRGPRSEQAPAQRRLQTSWSLDNPAISSGTHNTERRVSAGAGNRRLLTAEEKIQLELKVMKEREDELRRERSWALARSQPDLLAALGEADCQEEDTAPAPGQLTRTMSNPNLLDDQEQLLDGPSAGRRRSGLIDQWESRIQGTKS